MTAVPAQTISSIPMRKKLIAGNWKMNKTSADAVQLVKDIVPAPNCKSRRKTPNASASITSDHM